MLVLLVVVGVVGVCVRRGSGRIIVSRAGTGGVAGDLR